jgi:L-fuconolactonase
MYEWLSPKMGEIYDDFEAGRAERELLRARIAGAILVQADDNEQDSLHMFSAADTHDWVLGVVAWIPLERTSEADALLDVWSRQETFCGIRQLVHDDPRQGFWDFPEVNQTAELLARRRIPLDVPDAWPRDLASLVNFAQRHPELVIVIDHLGKPPIESEELEGWKAVFRELGGLENIVVKFSGLHHPNRRFNAEGVQGLFDISLEVFGPQRMMVGSDWPISLPSGGYVPTWATIRQLLTPLSPAERDAIEAGTAKGVYGRSNRIANMSEKETL